MGRYLKMINRVVQGLEVKSGQILLLNRQQVYSKEKRQKFYLLSLKVARKNARNIITSGSEAKFLIQAAELIKMDKRELIDLLLERKERGE